MTTPPYQPDPNQPEWAPQQPQYGQPQYPQQPGQPYIPYGTPGYAAAPPQPKAKKPFYKRVWFIIAAAFVVLIVIAGVAGGGSKKEDTAAVAAVPTTTAPAAAPPVAATTAATTPAPAAPPSPKPSATGLKIYQFGETYTFADGKTMTVSNLGDQSTYSGSPATTVDVTIGNNTSKVLSMNLFSITVDMQAGGRQALWSILDTKTISGDILPGQSLTGTFWFQETQTGQINVTVQYSGQKAYWTITR